MESNPGSTTICSSPKPTIISSVCTTPPFKNETFLRQKYEVEGLSARQIAFLIGCAHSVINRALITYGIKKTAQRGGWIEYGWKMKNGKRVPHTRQQTVIHQMRRWRTKGWAYGKIAEKLNGRKIPAPAGGIWYAATVGKIVKRRESKHPPQIRQPK